MRNRRRSPGFRCAAGGGSILYRSDPGFPRKRRPPRPYPAPSDLPCASSASKPPATKPASRSTTPSAGSWPTRCTRRSRCTRPTAASCPSLRRAITSGASFRWRSACCATPGTVRRRARRHRLHAGARTRGRAARRRECRKRAGLCARHARSSASTTWRATCCRRCCPTRSPRSRSSRCSCPADTRS